MSKQERITPRRGPGMGPVPAEKAKNFKGAIKKII